MQPKHSKSTITTATIFFKKLSHHNKQTHTLCSCRIITQKMMSRRIFQTYETTAIKATQNIHKFTILEHDRTIVCTEISNQNKEKI